MNREIITSRPPSFYIQFPVMMSLAMYMLSVLSGFLTFAIFSKSFSLPIKNSKLLHIFLLSQIGKYLPGNIGQYVGRFYLGGRYGIPHVATATIVLLEIASIVLSAVLIISASSNLTGTSPPQAWLESGIVEAIFSHQAWVTLGIVALLGVVISFKQIARDKMAAFAASMLPGVTCFICLGASLRYLMVALGADASFPQIIIWSAMSWLLGFVTPGSPAGVGIREYLLIQFLSPVYGPASAIATALLFRIISSIGDCILAVLGALIGRTQADRSS
jgi:hypothetical protein